MGNRILYIFLLLAISLRLAAADYTVSVTTNTCSEPQTCTIPEGEQIVLHAHPIAGYTFSQWSDGNTDNPRIVTIASDVSYMAEFVAMSPVTTIHNVVVSADGCTSKEIKVEDGSAVKIYPHAKLGYTFSQWSDGNTDNPRVAIINADATFVAQFKELDETAPDGMFTIVVKADGCGTALTQYVSADTEVKFYAHPKECNYFVKWSDGNTDNPRTVTVNSDATYTAIFKAEQYIITAESADETQGTVTIEVNDTPSTPSQSVAAFSVSKDKQVTFSPGNLQYHPKNNEWRFAPNQTDYIGAANSNISSTYNGWIDLFGWGTGNAPTKSSESYSDYQTYVDWGTNKIGNDAPNVWRTLTNDEWDYLVNNRKNSSSLCGVAQVNGVNGLIFLPDNWTCPADVTFKSGFHSDYGVDYYAAYQTFTAEQWSKLEKSGAIFLPAAGLRDGLDLYQVHNGYYWSATEYDSNHASCLYVRSYTTFVASSNSFTGQSVRLVKDLMYSR